MIQIPIRSLVAFIIVIGTVASAPCQVVLPLTGSRVAQQIELQIHRMERALDVADNQVVVEKIRMDARLTSSEEGIKRQRDVLLRVKEQIREQQDVMNEKSRLVDQELRGVVRTRLSDIDSRTQELTQLIERIKSMRERLEAPPY
jgi:hypothetical protein